MAPRAQLAVVDVAQNSGAAAPRARGVPFRPGDDPRRNRGGRPRGIVSHIREQTDDGRELIDLLLRIARDEEQPMKIRLEAICDVLDRGFGRAAQGLRLEVEPQRPDIAAMSAEERRATLTELRGRLDRLLARPADVIDGAVVAEAEEEQPSS
jgi:hypothetical protein